MPKPLKILLADDSSNIHRAVALAIRKEPYELIYCDNGQDAMRIIQEQHPALVMADLDMPGPTGREICQKIKSTPALSSIKVILLCGSFDQVEDQKLEALAADGRLWKPFESHVLLSLLSTVLKAPTIRPAEKTLVQTTQAPVASVPTGEFSDPLRELTTEMIRQTFNRASEGNVEPEDTAGDYLPPESPWAATPIEEPKVLQKLEATQSLPKDISPFERTLPPEEAVPEANPFGDLKSPTADDLWAPSASPILSSSPTLMNVDPNPSSSDLAFYREKNEGPSSSSPVVDLGNQDWNSPTMTLDRTALGARNPTQASLPKPPPPRATAAPTQGRNPTQALGPVATAGLDSEAVRGIVREEIQKAFDSWFRQRLEQKLQAVIDEIEKD